MNFYQRNSGGAQFTPSEMKMQQGASERRVYKREAHTQATSNDAASSFPMGIYLKFIYTLTYLFVFASVHALELDWRSIPFGFTNYSRNGIDGGAAIYSLPSQDTLKFKIDFVFPNGIFTTPQDNITTLNAMTDMLILGGFGGKSYEQIQKEVAKNGITLETTLNDRGQVHVSCEALTEDFQSVLALMHDLILQPRFDEAALALWKQQAKSQFINISNANTLRKQMLFINVETARLAFGPEHYQSTVLMRASPEATESVKLKKIKFLYQQMLNRNGLNVLLSGAYPLSAQTDVTRLIMKIPSKDFAIFTWLPNRLKLQSSHSKSSSAFIKTALIRKPDMTQSQISMRFYFPYIGDLNPIEKAQIAILSEIFSSTGGVVGNDRFSKAMRADSGLSYSAQAYFKTDVIDPNTNLSAFVLNFQSPNEKVFEAITLAKKTWDDFIQKGVSTHELERTRSAVMNSMLASDFTVFDRSNIFFSKILHGKIPSTNPILESLQSLEAQRNVDPMNTFLKAKFGAQNIGTLVIMGNPSEDELEKLKNLSVLDFVEIKEVNSLL